MEVAITNFGCTIVSIIFPDEKGTRKNLVLGYEDLDGYVYDPFYIGCIVGRFANRISNASFKINDMQYCLAANDNHTGNHLHGGAEGFNKKVFSVKETSCTPDACSLQLFYSSRDGDEGYPGNLEVTVTYSLTINNQLRIDYDATTDVATPVSLTNHSYFNLSGSMVAATNQELYIQAEKILVTDANYIPTGQVQSVAGTGWDFSTWKIIEQTLKAGHLTGYNEYFIFNPVTTGHTFQAALRHPASGIGMMVTTSLPGMMLYTGDFLKAPFSKQQGICLETHLYPDSPNRPAFPTAVLYPGDTYRHFTTYHFYNVLDK